MSKLNTEHEAVYLIDDPKVHLKAIVAIHSTKLGPATGGTRIWNYPTFQDALTDALNLSRAMTYKIAGADLNFGGGKAVIWLDPRKKTKELLRTYAGYLNNLEGKFYTGEDANITMEDIREMAEVAPGVIMGKPKTGGDPGYFTAKGILCGMEACLNFLRNSSLKNKTVVVHGIGNVGGQLVKMLSKEGAKIYVSDINQDRLKETAKKFNAKIVAPSIAHKVKCDIYSPCLTLGGILNKKTIPELKCKIIAGSTNNQLKDLSGDDKIIFGKGILYAPDHAINAGGLITVMDEVNPSGYSKKRVEENVGKIYERVYRILYLSKNLHISTQRIANLLAESRFK